MKSRVRVSVLSLAAGVALLAGCAAHQKTPSATFERIGEELQTAVSGKAKTLDDVINQAMLPPLQLDLPASAQSVEPRFDLAVSNAPAAQVFMALVNGTRYSMLLSPDVSGNVTLNLKNVTVREAPGWMIPCGPPSTSPGISRPCQ